jgi:hypothetical protein
MFWRILLKRFDGFGNFNCSVKKATMKKGDREGRPYICADVGATFTVALLFYSHFLLYSCPLSQKRTPQYKSHFYGFFAHFILFSPSFYPQQRIAAFLQRLFLRFPVGSRRSLFQ